MIYSTLSLLSYILYDVGGEVDFSTNAINITFPADEGASLVLQIDAKVPIVDDQIDEADREYFILHLSPIDGASSYPSIILDDPVSVGTIFDSDSELVVSCGYMLSILIYKAMHLCSYEYCY